MKIKYGNGKTEYGPGVRTSCLTVPRRTMSIICKMFGHQMPKWKSYHTVAGNGVDGIGRWHGYLKCECPRCGEVVSSGMVHLPTNVPKEKSTFRNPAQAGLVPV